jgi:hypothetical protein
LFDTGAGTTTGSFAGTTVIDVVTMSNCDSNEIFASPAKSKCNRGGAWV